jgi:hypothetical protein
MTTGQRLRLNGDALELARNERESMRGNDTEQQRLKRAMARVLPLVDTAGVRYGYMVAGLRGRPAYGPFAEATQALECALEDMAPQARVMRQVWADRKAGA